MRLFSVNLRLYIRSVQNCPVVLKLRKLISNVLDKRCVIMYHDDS